MRQSYLILISAFLVFSACDDPGPTEPEPPVEPMPPEIPFSPVTGEEAQQVKSELAERSFRRFDPSRDAPERRTVVLDFSLSDGQAIGLWAQHARNDSTVAEWEVNAKDYSIGKSGSEYRLVPVEPTSSRSFPAPCEDCIPVTGLSISVRNLFNGGNIQFKLNDDGNQLPSPFPVFDEWGAWSEDEYFEE